MKPSIVRSSALPTYDRFKPKKPSTKPLTTAQQLVADNRKKLTKPLRRRNTAEVDAALVTTPIEIGSTIWIPDDEVVWKIGEIKDYEEYQLQVQVGTQLQILDLHELGDIYKVNPRVVDDMTGLYYIHEAGILNNLKIRSQTDHMRPYTYMANVLIAVNPLCQLVEPKIEDYIKTQMGDRPPHPYAIAEVAFQQMALRSPEQCQSIVISGESGAGKTETSKIVLRYLTSREHIQLATKKNKLARQASWDGTSSELDRRLLDTNPILEAFGNAKTLRNHNSSRFGKFMKLQFSPDAKHSLVGAYIETYLLEKSRLVYQIPQERNFHIFYYLLAGASTELRTKLQLKSVDEFHYLNQSGCVSDQNIDDEILYDEVISALDTIGIQDKLQEELLTILAALLHVGNIELIHTDTAEGDAAEISSMKPLELASTFLGVDATYFQRVICKREIFTRGEKFTIPRNQKEGGYVRDAIAKSIYQHLFGWIVYYINKSLGHGPSTLPFIGVLDIFGFESFDYNDFEQLLINYANEALQATFNQQVFIAEQELFDKEGIEVGKIIWPDNRECIELIGKKLTGILPLLDAEAKTQQPSDVKWNATLHKTHDGHAHFLPPHEKDKKYVFIVKHFATKVEYHVGNFVDKNNDTIPKDLEDFVMSSTSVLIKEMFSLSEEKLAVQNTNKVRSVSGKFCRQMDSLVQTLNATRCNFIRCVKPNATMTYGQFDNGYVVDQLRCTGMLATCELLKVGLPTRVAYSEICKIYKPVLPPKVTPMFDQYTDRTFTEAVLWAFRVDPDAYRLGRTKVFFKTGKIALLDALLKVDMKKMGPWIVSRLKKWLARRRWRYATAKIMGQRGFLSLLDLIRKKKQAAVKVQSILQMFRVRKAFIKKREQHRIQMRKKAKARIRWRKAITVAQAWNAVNRLYAASHAKLEAEKARIAAEKARQNAAALPIQSLVRGHLGRKRANFVKQRKEEALLRERLAREEAEAEARRRKIAQEKAARARHRWKMALYAIMAQKVFNDRFKRIHTAHVMAEEARQRKLQEEAEERRLAEEAQRREEEEQLAAERAILAARDAEAAVKIQSSFRGYTGRQEAKRQAAVVTAQAAAVAAAQAAEEAQLAAEAADKAQIAEAAALQGFQEPQLSSGIAGTLGAVGTATAGSAALGMGETAIEGALVDRQESLGEADLSWMAADTKVEGEGVTTGKSEELAQAGRDLFGEGGEQPQGPLMEAEEENLINPVERIQEFATGPPIPYKGGIFTATMLGHRKQQDENWGDEYTEYVIRCTWGRDILEQSKTAWLVGGRYNDFNALHQELKAAASGKRGKRAPWFPRFPKRHPFSSMIGKNQEEKFIQKREKELNRYMTQVLTQMPDALENIHMDRFLNLTLRTQDICEREAYAEARKRWEEEEREAMANAAEAEPLAAEELKEVEQLVHQLLEKIIYSSGDVRHDTQLQEMLHAVKVLQPRVAASAQIGAGVDMELVPLSMQLQDDIQDAFNQYNDTLLALRLGHELST